MGTVQAPSRHTLKLWGTWALAFVPLWFAYLAFVDLLSFTQPSRYAVIELAADSGLWGWLFGVAGISMLVTLVAGPVRHNVAMSRVCSVTAAFIGAWAFFTLLWGLTTDFPVSLAVFGPAVFSVVGAQVLAVSWNHKE